MVVNLTLLSHVLDLCFSHLGVHGIIGCNKVIAHGRSKLGFALIHELGETITPLCLEPFLFCLVELVIRVGLFFVDEGPRLGFNACLKNSVERVVIACGHRLKFVIVATCTSYSQSHQATSDQIDPVIQTFIVHIPVPLAPDGKEAECSERRMAYARL